MYSCNCAACEHVHLSRWLEYMRAAIELLTPPRTCERAAACEAFHLARSLELRCGYARRRTKSPFSRGGSKKSPPELFEHEVQSNLVEHDHCGPTAGQGIESPQRNVEHNKDITKTFARPTQIFVPSVPATKQLAIKSEDRTFIVDTGPSSHMMGVSSFTRKDKKPTIRSNRVLGSSNHQLAGLFLTERRRYISRKLDDFGGSI